MPPQPAESEAEVIDVDDQEEPQEEDEQQEAGDDQAGDDQAGDDQAGDDQAGDDQAGDDQAGDDQDVKDPPKHVEVVNLTKSSPQPQPVGPLKSIYLPINSINDSHI